MVRLLGPQDRLLTTIEHQYPRRRRARARQPGHPRGPGRAGRGRRAARRASSSCSCKNGADLGPVDVTSSARILRARRGQPGRGAQPGDPHGARQEHPARRPSGQKAYVDAIDEHTIVFGIGPAGTGKTYLAMAKAVQALQRKEVERIILTRPAVEAGERLGFLPGTLTDKIDPYLRPLYDALNEMMDPELVPKLLAAGTVEVAPLAYMRGRTLNNAFVVLDEAQNTTPEQMKMFLTRLGFGTRMVVTGDITQIDLPTGHERAAARHAGARRGRRHLLRPPHQRRRGAPHPRRPHRRRLHRVRRAAAGARLRTSRGSGCRVRQPRRASRSCARRTTRPPAPNVRAGGADVSIEINNESGAEVDEARAAAPGDLRPRPPARAPGCRARDPARRRGRDGAAARAVDGRARARPTC